MTLIPPDTLLAHIRNKSELLIDEADEALYGTLTTDSDTADSPEARVILTGARKAAKSLLDYLEQNYDFVNGTAYLKEEEYGPTSAGG